MLNLNTKIDFFSSKKRWLFCREKTLFKSIEEVKEYQKKRLCFLEKYYDIKKCDLTGKIAEPTEKCQKKIEMYRSGTTSLNTNRTYFYSMPQQSIMELHHFWKIETTNKILKPGNIVWIQPADPIAKDESGFVLGNPYKDRIYGPKNFKSLGEKNKVYELYFNAKFKKDHWGYNLNLMKNKFDLKLIRTSPSVVQTIYSYFGDEYKFNCPVVLSEETLHADVRRMAEEIFTKVIDKCMCWDGGLGWFECAYQTKHIYDEFCLIEELEEQTLAVTDLQNLSTPFFRYLNGDKGSIGQIDCPCGLSGNYFKEFYGKVIEAIYINEKESPLPGRYISEKLSGFFRLGSDYNYFKDNALIENDLSPFKETIEFPKKIVYRIKQTEELEINFFYMCEKDLNEEQKKRIINFLNIIIWQNKECKKINIIKDEELFKKESRRSKALFIESDFIKKNKVNLPKKDMIK